MYYGKSKFVIKIEYILSDVKRNVTVPDHDIGNFIFKKF